MSATTQSAAELSATFAEATSHNNPGRARMFRFLLSLVPWVAPLLLALLPVVRLKKIFWILGYEDAVLALSADSMFATPFKSKMQKLDSHGEISLLGFDPSEDAAYRRNLCQVMQAMPISMLGGIAAEAASMAKAALAGRQQVDMLADLLIPITLQVTQRHFGMAFDDPSAFYHHALAMSNFSFSGPSPDPNVERAAIAAGKLTDMEMALKIAAARGGPPADTVLGRLVAMPALNDARVQATFAGLLVGMLPNIPISGYNILQVLLARPAAMRMARAAAAAGDDDLLQRCLIEALRFRPIVPATFRVCSATAGETVGPADRQRRHIPNGADVGVVNLVAMFDPRQVARPRVFDPGRPRSDNLAFGHGQHWCVGQPVALTVLMNVFKPLLLQGEIRRDPSAAPTKYFLDFFPENFGIAIGPGA